MVFQQSFQVDTRGRGSYAVTREVQDRVAEAGIRCDLCNLFVHHTSASLILCENADPSVRSDLERFMSRLVPDGDGIFEHTQEGPDDMPAHVRSVLTQSDLNIPILDSRCALGTWQGVYLWEHRYRPHDRTVLLTIQGE